MTKDEFRAILKKHTSYSGGLQCWLVGDEQLDALVAAITAQPKAADKRALSLRFLQK